MLKPNGQWSWYLDNDSGYLCIDLGNDLHLTTALGPKQLVPFRTGQVEFNIDHLNSYAMIGDLLEECGLELSAPQRTQIALNATAALAFHKPVVPKSWLYKISEDLHKIRNIAAIKSELTEGLVLLLEVKDEMSLCMLLSKGFFIKEGREETPFTLYKLVNDRFFAVNPKTHDFTLA